MLVENGDGSDTTRTHGGLRDALYPLEGKKESARRCFIQESEETDSVSFNNHEGMRAPKPHLALVEYVGCREQCLHLRAPQNIALVHYRG